MNTSFSITHSWFQLELRCQTLEILHYWLAHWGRDKMATISQTTFSSAFSWMKLLNFRSNLTEIYSLGSNWEYGSIGSDNGLVPNRHQAIIWSSAGMLYWCIYVSLGSHELVAWWNMFYYQHGVDKIWFACYDVYNFKQWLFCIYIYICIHMCSCICICLG